MKDEVLKLLPEIEWISDGELREKVLRVWEEALKRGNWSVDKVKEIPFTLLIKDCPVSLIDHIRAVTRMAEVVYKEFRNIYGDLVPLNHDYLIAGAILHDIGKFVEYEVDNSGKFVQTRLGKMLRHPFTGAMLADEFGLPPDISHIIATHSHEGDRVKRTPESEIVHRVDFINFEVLKGILGEGK